MIKSSFEFLVARLYPYCQVSIVIVGENTCNGKKMYQIMSKHKNMYITEMLQVKDDNDRKYKHIQIVKFNEFIEELFGEKK